MAEKGRRIYVKGGPSGFKLAIALFDLDDPKRRTVNFDVEHEGQHVEGYVEVVVNRAKLVSKDKGIYFLEGILVNFRLHQYYFGEGSLKPHLTTFEKAFSYGKYKKFRSQFSVKDRKGWIELY